MHKVKLGNGTQCTEIMEASRCDPQTALFCPHYEAKGPSVGKLHDVDDFLWPASEDTNGHNKASVGRQASCWVGGKLDLHAPHCQQQKGKHKPARAAVSDQPRPRICTHTTAPHRTRPHQARELGRMSSTHRRREELRRARSPGTHSPDSGCPVPTCTPSTLPTTLSHQSHSHIHQ